jgi:hypothetical protein
MNHSLARWLHRSIGLLLLAAQPGCSLIFVTPPRSDGRIVQRPKDCTSSKAAPIVDSIIGGLQVARTGLAVAADDSDYSDAPISREADIGLGVAFTTLFVGSAVYGFLQTGHCQSLRDAEESRDSALQSGR